jgi:enamine deaminase RidA (YjgF/YER057c/UK114 family)
MADENKADVSYVNPPSLEPPPGYSHAVDVRGRRLIFIAGQAAVNAQGIVSGGKDIEAQADRMTANVLSPGVAAAIPIKTRHGV